VGARFDYAALLGHTVAYGYAIIFIMIFGLLSFSAEKAVLLKANHFNEWAFETVLIAALFPLLLIGFLSLVTTARRWHDRVQP